MSKDRCLKRISILITLLNLNKFYSTTQVNIDNKTELFSILNSDHLIFLLQNSGLPLPCRSSWIFSVSEPNLPRDNNSQCLLIFNTLKQYYLYHIEWKHSSVAIINYCECLKKKFNEWELKTSNAF